MSKVNLAIGIHCHQPVGNFGFVFEEAYNMSYEPFLKVAERHPQLNLSWHFSGSLLDWIEDNHREFIDRLALLVSDHGHELMTGGYYEPILPAVPFEDAVGQIEKLSDYIQSRFGVKPRGLWLPERVWEPHLPQILARADIDYTCVDDFHFKCVGLGEDDLTGYFTTEDQGHVVNVFPISQKLRYLIPFADVAETVEYLKSFLDDGENNLLVLADDGEKFGLWPGTHKLVYTDGWLEAFFNGLENEADWLNVVTFSHWLDERRSKGQIYLPNSSYFEMGKWSYTTEARENIESLIKNAEKAGLLDEMKPFLKSGFWRNFLVKYPEVGHMHKRMTLVSEKVRSIPDSPALKQEALNHVWMAQTNCPYWHGVFGGIYLPHLRDAVYRNLIRAEAIIDDYLDRGVEPNDFNKDGDVEYLLRNDNLFIIAEPEKGGIISECDYMPAEFNILNTIARQREAYHSDIKEKLNKKKSVNNGVGTIHHLNRKVDPDIADHLQYDRWRKGWFVDHIISPDYDFSRFVRDGLVELSDIAELRYKMTRFDNREAIGIAMTSGANIANAGRLNIKKELMLEGEVPLVRARYHLKCEEGEIHARFLPELNFSLLGAEGKRRRLDFVEETVSLDGSGAFSGSEVRIIDEYQGFVLKIIYQGAADAWVIPVKSVSQSESSYELIYQSTQLMPVYDIALSKGDIINMNITLEFSPL